MMVILHFIPTLAGGGAERQLAMLAIEQARQGHRVHVGVRTGGVHEQALRDEGIVVHKLGNHRGPSPVLALKIWRLVRRVQPHVVQTWLMQMDLVGGAVALLCAVPWVGTERSSAGAYQSAGLRWRVWLRRFLFARADAIVANSTMGAAYWRAQLGPTARVHRVGNAIDVAAIRAVDSLHCGQPPSHRHQILVVGRLIASKALDVVIEAVDGLPADCPVQVRIIGDGPLHAEVDAAIQRRALSGRVTLHPYSDKWWCELHRAAVLVSMSRYEGQPNVVLEAMAAGCPLIVSDIPAHREILNEASALFVPVDHAQALVSALLDVLADRRGADQRAQQACALVEQLTVQNAKNAYDQVYSLAMRRGV
ncbi:MAG: glycosyltransferase [Aquabacterium sp.]